MEEHYTDTAGYTDQVFGLTHLWGLCSNWTEIPVTCTKIYH
ncbi:transposase [Clostridium tagluense]|nr:transposase [Clostridium tagluense]